MATALDKKISALTAAAEPLSGTEAFPITQGGVTKQCPVSALSPQDASSSTAGKVLIDPAGSVMVTVDGIRGALGVIDISASRAITNTDHFHTLVCKSTVTLTLPRSNTKWNGFCFIVLAQGGDVTVTPDAADSIAGGIGGGSYFIPRGSSVYLSSDGAFNGAWSPIAVGKQFDVFNMPTAAPSFTLTPSLGTDPTLLFSRLSHGYGSRPSGEVSKALPNCPRAHKIGGALAYLAEEQSTNLLTYSNTLSDASWTKLNSTAATSVKAAPDGSFTASTLTDSSDGVASYHRVGKSHSTTGMHTSSAFLKAGTRDYASVVAYNATDGSIYLARLNLLTGQVTYTTGTGSYTVHSAGDGWWRLSITYTCTVATTVFVYLSGATNELYQGDGTGNIHVWCVQSEQLPYATSPMPTDSAQVTRSAETITVSDISWVNPDQGTLYLEFYHPGLGGSTAHTPFTLGSSTDSVRVVVTDATDDLVYLRHRAASVDTDAALTASAITPRDKYRVAISYQPGTVKACVNGGSIGTVAQSVPAITEASLGGCGLLGACYYPVYMSDQELKSLTGM